MLRHFQSSCQASHAIDSWKVKSTVPILEGDPKYSTERGPKRGPKTEVVQKIEKSLYVEIFQKLNLGKEKTISVFFAFILKNPH